MALKRKRGGARRSSKRRKISHNRGRRRHRAPRGLVPNSKIVNFRYVGFFEINPPIGQAGQYLFRANSIYDPDYTGIGHQPLGHDQWNEFYNHYVVLGSKIRVQFNVQSTSAMIGQALCGIHLKDTPGAVTLDPQNVMEQNNSSSWKLMGVLTSGKPMVTVTKGYSPRKFFGVKDVADNHTRIGAAFGSNPTEDVYFVVNALPTQFANDVGTLHCIAHITYRVLLTERKDMPTS